MPTHPRRAGLSSLRRQAALIPGARPPSAVYHVAPWGNDAGTGTVIAPWRTLSRAQATVRAFLPVATGDITVLVRGGMHVLTAPLALGPQDGAHNGYLARWQAFPGEIPVLSGGIPVRGWTVAPGRPWLSSAPLPVGATPPRQMYVNSMRAVRARQERGLTAGAIRGPGGYTTVDNAMAAWTNRADPSNPIEFVYRHTYSEQRVPVTSVAGSTVTMVQPAYAYASTSPYEAAVLPTAIENAYELLSASTPGSFFCDRLGAVVGDGVPVLYYVPRPGDTMTTATVMIPQTTTLLSVGDATGMPVANLLFSGLSFMDTAWPTVTTDGYPDISIAGFALTADQTRPFGQIPAAVHVSAGRNVTFADCVFAHLGGSGLVYEDGAQAGSIRGNIVTDVSGQGIRVGTFNVTPTTPPVRLDGGMTIANNAISAVGQEYTATAGIIAAHVGQATIRNNDVRSSPYIGIFVGNGQAGPTELPEPGHDVTVLNNNVLQTCLALPDGGGIYSQGPNPHGVIAGNVSDDCRATAGGALYLDDGTRYVTLVNNVARGSVHAVHLNDIGGNTVVAFNHLDQAGLDGAVVGPRTLDATTIVARTNPNAGASGLSFPYPPAIINRAGLEPAYAHLLTGGPALPPTGVGVTAPVGPSQVVSVWGTATGGGGFTVSWTPPVSVGAGLAQYEIVLSTPSLPTPVVAAQVPAGTTSVALAGLVAGPYRITVRAVDSAAVESIDSPPLTAVISSL